MLVIMYVFFQIVGESFPISSSGHLIFLQKIYYFLFPQKLNFFIPTWFDYLLHLPTVLIVLYYFQNRFFKYLTSAIKKPFALYPVVRILFITDGITAFFYIGKEYLQSVFPLWAGFLVTAVALHSLCFVSEKPSVDSLEDLSLKNIFMVALAQSLSLLPGVSRFGLTYVVARWQGLSNNDSFFYSFLIALPLFGAAGMKGMVTFLNHPHFPSLDLSPYLIVASIVLATLLSYYSFRVVGLLVRTNRLWYISYYMFVMSAIAGISSLLV